MGMKLLKNNQKLLAFFCDFKVYEAKLELVGL